MMPIILGSILYGGLLKLGANMNNKTIENIKKIHDKSDDELEELRKIVKLMKGEK